MLQIFLVSAVVLLAGCSFKKNMEDTKNNAEEMKGISKSLKTSQEYLTIMARSGSAGAFSVEQFRKIKEANTVSEKLAEATVYFAGMEYQYWVGWGQDTQALRESMWAKNLEMFFVQTDQLVKNSYPFAGTWWSLGYKPDPKMETLGVIAISMSKLAEEQHRMTQRTGIKSVSAYDMIKEGLKYKADYDAGKPIPEWAKVVVKKQKTAIYLLQLRHNFFPLLVLAQMSALKDNPKLFVLKSMVFDFEIDLNNYDRAELDSFSEMLAKGQDAHDYITRELCIPAKYIKLTRHLYRSAEFVNNKAPYAQNFLKALGNATQVELQVFDPVQSSPNTFVSPDGFSTVLPSGF